MKQFQNISTLIFDFGDVIVNLDKQRCIRNFQELGFTDIDKYLGDFVQSGLFLDFETGKINAEQFRNKIRENIQKEISDEQIDHAWDSFLVDIPEKKLDMLLELRKKFKVFLLSNTNPIHMVFAENIFRQHKGLSMNDYFDKRYLSYQMGVVKPDAEIFEIIIDDSGINPAHTLFFDDGPKNIEVANQLGFQTYLVHKNEDLGFLLEKNTWG